MKLITKDTDYAVRAICFIAQDGEKVVSVSKLVKELKIPRPFLRKLMQRLNKTGILNSYKGKGGGFSLGRSADKIFLVDLIKIFQGPLKINNCIIKKNICPDTSSCLLKQKIKDIEKQIVAHLDAINIASLLN